MEVSLVGDFINIYDMYLIRVDKVLKWNKFDYVEDGRLRVVKNKQSSINGDKYCILVSQVDDNSEVLYFNTSEERDSVFVKIINVIRYSVR